MYRAVAARTSPQAALSHALTTKEALRFLGIDYESSAAELVLDITIAPYLDESGAARGLLWIADDVTEAVRVKGKLLLAERLATVGRLSAQVAHEVRNPLSAIGLNAELLEDDFAAGLPEPKRTEAVQLLRAIGSEVERLTQVTEGYLQLARLPHPNASDTDVNVVVSDLATMLREEMSDLRSRFFGDEAAAAEAAEIDALRERVVQVESQINSQFTSLATYAQIAQEQVELARAEARAATERSEKRVIELVERERADRITSTELG